MALGFSTKPDRPSGPATTVVAAVPKKSRRLRRHITRYSFAALGAERSLSVRIEKLAHITERPANVFGKQLRLLPRCKMAANVVLLVIDELWIRVFRPAPWGLVEFVRECAHTHRYAHAFDVEKIEFIFPVEARRRDAGVREPVERGVVEVIVGRDAARMPEKRPRKQLVAVLIVV